MPAKHSGNVWLFQIEVETIFFYYLNVCQQLERKHLILSPKSKFPSE